MRLHYNLLEAIIKCLRSVLRTHDEIQIAVESKNGFYKSLNKTVALTPKILIVSLILGWNISRNRLQDPC